MWLILAAGTTLFLFYYFFVKPLNYWKERGVVDGNALPILGDNWKPMFRLQSFFELVREVYQRGPGKRYVGMFQMTSPTLVLKDPELIKQIAVKDFAHFTDHRSFIDPIADPLWGKNLFALTGQTWKDMRATLTPSFTSSKMRYMFTLMSEAASNFIDHFKKKDQDIIEVELKDCFTRYTNDVIATTAFGIKVDSLENQENDFFMMGTEATNFTGIIKNLKFFGYFLFPRVSRFFGIKIFSKQVRNFFYSVIDETIQHREENNLVRPDMINLLLEARKGITKTEDNGVLDSGIPLKGTETDENIKPRKQPREITNADITSQALIFFFAGFDTVSTLMCFTAYELAINPDIQKRLREEIMETSEECNGNVSYEALLKMKYLDMVISEALRKWPPAVATDRVCTKPYTIEPVLPEEKPIELKVDDIIWIPQVGLHYDSNYFPNPEKFDPERFSDENIDNIRPYTYVPFGIGPRSCIGNRFALLETKAVIFKILSNFEIVPTKRTQIPLKISRKGFNLLPEKMFWLGLKRLNKT